MAEQQKGVPGFPPDAQIFTLEKFASLNTKSARQSIEDQEFSWLENFMPIGDGNLRTLYSHGTSIYTATGGRTIIFPFFYNIGSTQYAIVFLDNGTADQVNVNTLAITHVTTTPGTFYNGGDLPDAQQYGSSGIVIVTTVSSNGYYAWDGVLYSPTNPAPTWLSGLATPFTPTGTTHSSTTIDTISSMTGIEAGMSVTGSGIPANTVVVSVNTGGSSIVISQAATSSAGGVALTFTWSMPTGVSGTTVEVYQNRVWVGNGARILFSAPGNGANFSTADGGGSYTSTDAFLKQKVVQIRQSNGFLYTFGDSSINSISNVNTTGSPATTTFNNINADPQVGTPWHGSVIEFGRALMLANTSGVYVVFGGAAEKVSDKLDGIFFQSSLPITGTLFPSAAIATIFGIKVYMLLIPGAVDYLGVSRPLLCIWDGKKWFIGSQTVNLKYVTTQEVQSTLTAYGTDGTNLFPLFTSSSATLSKTAQGKLWPGDSYLITKQGLRAYLQVEDNAGTGVSFVVNVDTELTTAIANFTTTNILQFQNNLFQNLNFVNNLSQPLTFTVPADSILGQNVDIYGNLLGLTMTTSAKDATITTASLLYRNYRGLY